jgi:hypothetical protein
MYRGRDGEDEELQLLPASRAASPAAWYTCLCILFLLGALFLAYCIYALAGANSTVDACGKGLWYFVVIRLVAGFFASIILMQVRQDEPGTNRVHQYDESEMNQEHQYEPDTNQAHQDAPKMNQAVRWFIGALHLVSLVVGSMQTHAALEDGACVAAMSAASYTGTPLLAIVSVFFLVDDGVSALSALCVFFTSVSAR